MAGISTCVLIPFLLKLALPMLLGCNTQAGDLASVFNRS